MARNSPKTQQDRQWVVTSGARMLPPVTQQRPRPAPRRTRERRASSSRLTLIPLSRRPVIIDW